MLRETHQDLVLRSADFRMEISAWERPLWFVVLHLIYNKKKKGENWRLVRKTKNLKVKWKLSWRQDVTGKFTDFPVCVIRNIFIRKLSHLTISSPFILINQKMHKNHSSFWIDFCCYSLSSHAPACRHFCYLLHGFF